jgi:hypothetical protein
VSDRTIELIRNANPYPHELPPLPIEPVMRRLAEPEPRRATATRRIALPDLRRGAGALLLGLSSLIAVAIVAVAITQLSPRHTQARTGSPGATELLAKIAVLRRPQSTSDLLPRHLHFRNLFGSVIPRLTRLVYRSGGTQLFLIAATPAADDPLWGPRYGDQVAIVAVAGDHASETRPIPAADLSDADEVDVVSPERLPSAGSDAYNVAVVPDGVARVSWSFDGGKQGTPRTVDATARDNLAILPYNTGVLTHAAWYDAQGHVIPTSDAAFLKAIDRRNAATAAPIIRYFERHPQPRPAVTRDFAIFSVTSARGIQTASGDTISAPPLTKLPVPILSLTYHGGLRFGQPDAADVRHVLTPTGFSAYVIPGTFGLCVYSVDTSPLPQQVEGGGGSCTTDTAQAEQHGSGFSRGSAGGVTTTFRILPKSIHTLTIRGKNGTRRTIQLPYGIYVHQQ